MVTDLRSQLQRDEGTKLRVYRDSVGKLTIGTGRNLEDRGISMAENDFLLDNDIRDARSDVIARLPWSRGLDEVRRDVLVNMAFNMGIGGLVSKNPKMLAALKRRDYEEAAREMLDGPWKDEVGDRAPRLADQMRTGVYQ